MENPRFDLPKNTWRRFDTPRRQRCQGLGDGTQSRGPASPRKKPKRGNPRNDEFDRSDSVTGKRHILRYLIELNVIGSVLRIFKTQTIRIS